MDNQQMLAIDSAVRRILRVDPRTESINDAARRVVEWGQVGATRRCAEVILAHEDARGPEAWTALRLALAAATN
jgi:hypothetical protein